MEKKIRTDDILDSAKNALKILLDTAENEHPFPCEAVSSRLVRDGRYTDREVNE